jgi:hypothetical protein
MRAIEIEIITYMVQLYINRKINENLKKPSEKSEYLYTLITDTIPYQLYDNVENYPQIDPYMLNDFKNNNQKRSHIDFEDDFDNLVNFMSWEENEQIFKDIIPDIGWSHYYRKYGYVSILRFSRPGFNRDKTQAMIYFSSTIASLSGRGGVAVLEKQAGQWIELGYIDSHIS